MALLLGISAHYLATWLDLSPEYVIVGAENLFPAEHLRDRSRPGAALALPRCTLTPHDGSETSAPFPWLRCKALVSTVFFFISTPTVGPCGTAVPPTPNLCAKPPSQELQAPVALSHAALSALRRGDKSVSQWLSGVRCPGTSRRALPQPSNVHPRGSRRAHRASGHPVGATTRRSCGLDPTKQAFGARPASSRVGRELSPCPSCTREPRGETAR